MSVRDEVMKAFSDCHMEDTDEGMRLRNLNFKASTPVSRDDAKAILADAIPHGYNEFEAALLDKFPEDTLMVIAREGSPAIYATAPRGNTLPKGREIRADECHRQDDGSVRYWWD